MRRPVLAIGIGYAIAAWASFFCAGTRTTLLLSLACAVTGAAAGIFSRGRVRGFVVVLLAAAMAFASHPLYKNRAIIPLQKSAGETVTVLGVVTAAERDAPFYSYTLRASFPERELPDATLVTSGYGEMDYLPGDVLRCTVTLTELNPTHRFYNYSRGVYVDAVLRSAAVAPFREAGFLRETFSVVTRLREMELRRLYEVLPEDSANLLGAMVLGVQDGVPAETSDAMNRSGTMHLLSVSGLHLSVLVGCLMRLLRLLRLPRVPRCLIAAACSVMFALLVGLSPSITRALVMTLVWLLAQALSKNSDSLSSLGLALFLLCIVWPQWTLNRGLWLSACSTAGIAAFAGPMQTRAHTFLRRRGMSSRGPVRMLVGAGCVSVSAYAFSLPVLMVTGGWISLVSPLSNLLIAPLIMPVLAGGLLCALLPGGNAVVQAVAWVADMCVRIITSVSTLLSSTPFAIIAIDQTWRLIWFLLAAVMAILLVAWRADGKLTRYAAALLAFSFAAGSLTLSVAGRSTVELITIERCSSAVLLREGSAVIVGTPASYEVGRLLRYLNYRGVRRIDALIVADCGEQIGSGLLRLASSYRIGCVIGPDDAFILGELSSALPLQPVYASGYATVRVLDAVTIRTDKISGDAYITIGRNSAVKSTPEYDIMGVSQSGSAYIGGRGVLWWPPSMPPAFEPMGTLLFGETRLVLRA